MQLRPLIVCLCLLAGLGAAAQTRQGPAPRSGPDSFSTEDLRRVEAAREEAVARLKRLEAAAAQAERELSEIDRDLLAAAEDSRAREEDALAAEGRLRALGGDLSEARARLGRDREAHKDLIAALLALSQRRPPALAASPEDASGAIRAAILMSEASPALRRRAKALAEEIRVLSDLQAEIRREQDGLSLAEAGLAARRVEISALQAEKQRARSQLAQETRRLASETAALAREAETLRGLLDGLTRSAPDAPGRKPRAPAEAARAAVSAPSARPRPPAVGARMAKTQPGSREPGVVFVTRPGAQVVAPMDARVEYSGLFRTYGQMLILDVGDDMLVVLSGMDAVFPEAGQAVLAGEPVGRMADRAEPGPELYMEVRRGGRPVNPETWLARGA